MATHPPPPPPHSTKLHGCTMTFVPRTKTLHRRSTTRHIGQKWFSTIDQRKAYQQRFMYPDDRHLTAFVNPSGLYEWIRIQTGLKNAPGGISEIYGGLFTRFS